MALTVGASLLALAMAGWEIQDSLHSKVGFSIFILALSLMFGGIGANILRVRVAMPWNTKWVLWVGKVHRWYGWALILFS